MDLTQTTGVLAKFSPVCEYSVCGSVGCGSRRHGGWVGDKTKPAECVVAERIPHLLWNAFDW